MALAHRRAGLAQTQRARPFPQPEQPQAHAHGARGDEHHLAPGLALAGDALDDVRQARGGELPIFGGHHGGADLDHQTVGLRKRGAGCAFLTHVGSDFTLDALRVVMRV